MAVQGSIGLLGGMPGGALAGAPALGPLSGQSGWGPLGNANAFSVYGALGDQYGIDSQYQPGGLEPPMSTGSRQSRRGQQLSFAGELIDKRYDEVTNETLCVYGTPLGTYSILVPGF